MSRTYLGRLPESDPLHGYLENDIRPQGSHRILKPQTKEVGGYYRAGKLKHRETVVECIDKAVEAFLGLFQGKNVGKMVVKLS